MVVNVVAVEMESDPGADCVMMQVVAPSDPGSTPVMMP